jgi:hypothetical protein
MPRRRISDAPAMIAASSRSLRACVAASKVTP